MATDRTSLVLGRGELYFNPYDPDTLEGLGELYLGNTPEFTSSRQVQTIDIMDSFDGQKVPVEGPVIREVHEARFTTDHISLRNLALWYGGETGTLLQARADDLEEIVTVYKGRHYQLGTTPTSPIGIRGIEDVSAKVGSTSIPMTGNFEVDKIMGRISVLDDAPDIDDGDVVTFSFQQRDVTSGLITSQKRELVGSLRFVSRNPIGPLKNYFYPTVKLTPTGDIDHKANDWQRVSFEVQAQRRNPLYDYVYIDELQVVGKTVFEYAIEELSGITIGQFPYWEDQLNTITNLQLPAHHSN